MIANARRGAASVGRSVLLCVLFLVPLRATAGVIVVNTTSDAVATNGVCSLREAIQNANANAAVNTDCTAGSGADSIVFSLPNPSVITLSGSELPQITDTLTISGPGASALAIDGGSSVRIFDIANAAILPIIVSMTGIHLRNGNAASGPNGTSGGAILSSGANLILTAMTFTSNIAPTSGGAISFSGTSGGVLLVSDTTFVSNFAMNGSGGAIDATNVSAAVTLQRDTFGTTGAGNTAGTNGGAVNVAFVAGGSLSATNDLFAGNVAGNLANTPGTGGALNVTSAAPATPVTIADSYFDSNRGDATDGAPILLPPQTANDFGTGGAVALSNASATIRRSYFTANNAAFGGAVAVRTGAQATLENDTLYGNRAINPAVAGGGAAVYVQSGGSAAVNETTIVNNTAATGRATINAQAGGTVTFANSIVSGSQANSGAAVDVDASGAPVAANYSFFEKPGTQVFTGTGNITAQTPQLGLPAANNSTITAGAPGSTVTPLTLLPVCGGNVMDKGDPAFAPPPSTDERGFARVSNGRIDMGAAEYQQNILQFATTAVNVPENAGTIQIVVNRTQGDGSASANVTFGGTAQMSNDYSPGPTTLNWNAGDFTPKQVAVIIVDDLLSEATETIVATLVPTSCATTASGGAETITITDNDPLPLVQINNPSTVEGNAGTKTMFFIVTLSSSSEQTVTVNYSTANGTATAGSDYVPTSGTLTFTPVTGRQQEIAVTILSDTLPEPDETFTVTLSSPTNATLFPGASVGTGTIVNDDPRTTDLSITKTARPGPYFVGTPMTYDINVTNVGPAPADTVVVTDTLPAGVTFTSATPSKGTCSGTTTITCTIGTLAVGASATIALRVQPTASGPVSNTASVSAAPQPDQNAANDSSSAAVTVQPASDIPTLSEWAKLLLALAVATVALLRMRQ